MDYFFTCLNHKRLWQCSNDVLDECVERAESEREARVRVLTGFFSLSKGNITAIKYISKKRIELTRKVLFELKHVSVPLLPPLLWDYGINYYMRHWRRGQWLIFSPVLTDTWCSEWTPDQIYWRLHRWSKHLHSHWVLPKGQLTGQDTHYLLHTHTL